MARRKSWHPARIHHASARCAPEGNELTEWKARNELSEGADVGDADGSVNEPLVCDTDKDTVSAKPPNSGLLYSERTLRRWLLPAALSFPIHQKEGIIHVGATDQRDRTAWCDHPSSPKASAFPSSTATVSATSTTKPSSTRANLSTKVLVTEPCRFTCSASPVSSTPGLSPKRETRPRTPPMMRATRIWTVCRIR